MKKRLIAWAVTIGFVGVLIGLAALSWCAYFERFPEAAWWTFFFRNGDGR